MQVYLAEMNQGRKITHIVFMGSGEPLDNFENVKKAIGILNHRGGRNISMRRITVSTVGILPNLRGIGNSLPRINLAVSLHNPIDKERQGIMPVAKLYPLKELISVLIEYQKKTRRQVTFEYVVLPGENTLTRHIKAIKEIYSKLDCSFNLIPRNELGYGMAKAKTEAKKFLKILKLNGISKATVRTSRGSDVLAACGQLLCRAQQSAAV